MATFAYLLCFEHAHWHTLNLVLGIPFGISVFSDFTYADITEGEWVKHQTEVASVEPVYTPYYHSFCNV